MSEQHNHDHDHPQVDAALVKRLRFVKLALDNLLLPDAPNREQAYAAALRMLEIIGVTAANFPASDVLNGWVYTKELLAGLQDDIVSSAEQKEVLNYLLRVEALAERPLDGREEEWAKEQEKLRDMNTEKPVAGLVRLIMLNRRMVKNHAAFAQVNIPTEAVFTSNHLIGKDLSDWKQLQLKPHWFTDEFLIFRESDEERLELPDEEQEAKRVAEEELVFKLFMVRHESPEGLNLKKFYRNKLAGVKAASSDPNAGEQVGEKSQNSKE